MIVRGNLFSYDCIGTIRDEVKRCCLLGLDGNDHLTSGRASLERCLRISGVSSDLRELDHQLVLLGRAGLNVNNYSWLVGLGLSEVQRFSKG